MANTCSRPLCAVGNYAQMKNAPVTWSRICAACAHAWPTQPRHSLRANEVSQRSVRSPCPVVARDSSSLEPELWQLRSTRSSASSHGACRMFKADEHSRDELGHRLTHEINRRLRGAARSSWCRELCKKVAAPCEVSSQEDLCNDYSDLHVVATYA